MMKAKYPTGMRYSQLSWQGFSTGVFLAYGYALLFFLYAGIRLTVSVVGIVEPPHLVKTLLLLLMSLLLTVLVFAGFMSLIAGIGGAMTAVAALYLTRWISYRKALVIFAVFSVMLIHLGILATTGTSIITTHLATYAFWFGLPALIYVLFCVIAGAYIEKSFNSNDVDHNESMLEAMQHITVN